MIDIALSAIPNQSFAVQIEDVPYAITLLETGGVMSATIERDKITLVSGLRVVGGTPLLPYLYLEQGNFMLLVENDELPYWDKFGVTQFMVFLSAAELAALRG